MRGKKTDSQFLSDFISASVESGIDNPEGIVSRAKSLITEIDEQIRNIEKQKLVRSKLLDVISAFEKPSKTSKHEEVKILSFFKIQNTHICKFVCDHLKLGVVTIEGLTNLEYVASDVLFCVKQLIEHKVLSKSGNHLLRGEMFDEYLKFVLRDN